MAQDKPALVIGGGVIKTSGRFIGQVNDIAVATEIAKAEHATNVGVQFTTDYVLPIMSGASISWVFQEISPYNVNYMLGQPGYRMAPSDRRLSNPAIEPGGFGDYGLLAEEYPTLGLSLEGFPMWSPLTHPIWNPNSSAPEPVRSVVAKNDETPSLPITDYWGFTATMSDPTDTHESVLCNIHVVPQYSTTDSFTVRVNLDSSHVATDIVKIYYFAYGYNSDLRSYYGTYTTTALADLDGGGTVNTVLDATDITNGYVDITVDTTYARIAGLPPTGIAKCTSIDGTTYEWLTDYEFDPNYRTGAQIRKSANPGGSINDWETVYVQYYYNGNEIIEAPLVQSDGSNPVVPITAIIPFPDNRSKLIIELPRVQIKNNMAIAVNERDWMGMPFAGKALDASDIYPDYPYGWLQIAGPMAARARAFGNVPFGAGIAGYETDDQRTTYA